MHLECLKKRSSGKRSGMKDPLSVEWLGRMIPTLQKNRLSKQLEELVKLEK